MASLANDEKTSFPKNKIKVLLLESISQSAIDILAKEGFQVESVHKLSDNDLKEKIKEVHIIGVRSKTKLSSSILEEAKKLLAVGCFCIGTDQTDLEFAASKGIPVFNSPYANTRSVAEMVLAELIILARQMGDRSMECHQGKWNKRSDACYEVRGKTLGIVGYGHVGSQLSIISEALGFRVIFYDILPKLPLGLASACNSLDELLSRADFVTLHVPDTNETKNMIGAKQIATMKSGSYLVNASRGTVVDVDATAAALRSGHLAGAAFDVYPYEPASAAERFVTPLQGCPNTFLTPHIGGSTEEAQTAIGVEVATKLVKFINQGNTIDSVNFPQVALPDDPNSHRMLHIHRNIPGVLKNINDILSQYNINGQMLLTRGGVGYLMADVNKEISHECFSKLRELDSTIRTRKLH